MYEADEKRYDTMKYNRCGNSGLLLPAVSLGLWQNFGSNGSFDNMQKMCYTANHFLTAGFFHIRMWYNMYKIAAEIPLLITTLYHMLLTPI